MYAKKLKLLRLENGLTQAKVAAVLGISGPSYAAYENGKSAPSIETLVEIAKMYGVSLDWLCGVECPAVSSEPGNMVEALRLLVQVLRVFHATVSLSYSDIEQLDDEGFNRVVDRLPVAIATFGSDTVIKFILGYSKLDDLRKEGLLSQELFQSSLEGLFAKFENTPFFVKEDGDPNAET